MRPSLGHFGCLLVVLALVSSHRMGGFRNRIHAELARVQVAATEKSMCEAARNLADVFNRMKETEWLAIDESVISKMSALLDQTAHRSGGGCTASVMAEMFFRLGTRAKAAAPALERALKVAELARVDAYERGTRTLRTPDDCLLFGLMLGINFDRKLDHKLRNTLSFIDGRERAVGYSLDSIKCPADGGPPG